MAWERSCAGLPLGYGGRGLRGWCAARATDDDRLADDLFDLYERVVRDRAAVPRPRDLFDDGLADEATHLPGAGGRDADGDLRRTPDELGYRDRARRLLRVEESREHVDEAAQYDPTREPEERTGEDAI